MKKKAILFLILVCVPAGILFSQANEKKTGFQLSFVPPLSTQGMYAAEYTHAVSFNILAGVSKNVTAFSLSSLGMYVKDEVNGFHLSGLGTYAGGTGKGVMISGLLNRTEDYNGFQLAGLFNAAKDVSGLQIAGLFNKAQNVKGLQLAVVNIAESSDYPIGLINIIKDGEMSLGLTYNEIGNTVLSFRSGGRILYAILGIGYNHKLADQSFMTEAGIGAHIPVSARFRINNEIKTAQTSFTDKENTGHHSYSLLPAFKIVPRWEIFGGPSLNYMYTDNPDNKSMFPSNSLWKKHNEYKLKQLYIGFSVGTHFLF